MSPETACPNCEKVRELLLKAKLLLANMPAELARLRAQGHDPDPLAFATAVSNETLDEVGRVVGIGAGRVEER